MNCRVTVHADSVPDALQVPVIAVFEEEGRYFCYVRDSGKPAKRPIKMGASNGKYVQIVEGLKRDLSVIENLRFYCTLWAFAGSPEELLVEVGLERMPQRRVRALSAGQKRRLALAALRAQQARLWILDEPMTNLDIGGRELVVDWVRRHIEDGGSAVIATHQSEVLTGIAKYKIEL